VTKCDLPHTRKLFPRIKLPIVQLVVGTGCTLKCLGIMSQSGYSLVLKEASLLDVEEIKADVPPADLKVIHSDIDGKSHNERDPPKR